MPYYPTIEEDLERAKLILERGKPDPQEMMNIFPHEEVRARVMRQGGAISGGDNYAAYKLLESFVAEIERLRGYRIPDARVIRQLRESVASGAGHECSEWRTEQGTCALCDRPVK